VARLAACAVGVDAVGLEGPMLTTVARPPADALSRAHGLLSGRAYFLHWGVIQISLANFVIIVAMVAIFVLALVVPFPHGQDAQDEERRDER
jgi:hypothetical protein